jgi:hypothetical protein
VLREADSQPANDQCSNAASLAIDSSVSGTNVNSTLMPTSRVPFCSDSNALSTTENVPAPGAWYTVVGKGEGIRAYACAASDSTFLERAVMAVYRDGCEFLRCSSVSMPEMAEGFCPDGVNGEVVSWFALEGVTYHLLVRGIRANAEGDFDLTVKRLPSLVKHDVCWNALPVKVSDGIVKDFIGGNKTSIDFRAQSCIGSGLRYLTDGIFNFQSTTGIWYLLEGTGDTVRVAPPCGGVAFSIRVYAGEDCTSLVCTGRRTQQNVCGAGWGNENVVIVNTVLGENYYVFVQHVTASTGPIEFELQLSAVNSGSAEILLRASSVLLLTVFSVLFLLI